MTTKINKSDDPMGVWPTVSKNIPDVAGKPSPGPWETSRDAVPKGHVQITVYDPAGKRVATVFEAEANAHLIASAPELLEALRECITSEGAACFSHMDKHPEWMQSRLYAIADIARAAIAKAEGKQ